MFSACTIVCLWACTYGCACNYSLASLHTHPTYIKKTKSVAVSEKKPHHHHDRLGVNCTTFKASIFQLCGNTSTNTYEKTSSYTNIRTTDSTTTSYNIGTFTARWSPSIHLLLHSSEFLELPITQFNGLQRKTKKIWNENRLSLCRRQPAHIAYMHFKWFHSSILIFHSQFHFNAYINVSNVCCSFWIVYY